MLEPLTLKSIRAAEDAIARVKSQHYAITGKEGIARLLLYMEAASIASLEGVRLETSELLYHRMNASPLRGTGSGEHAAAARLMQIVRALERASDDPLACMTANDADPISAAQAVSSMSDHCSIAAFISDRLEPLDPPARTAALQEAGRFGAHDAIDPITKAALVSAQLAVVASAPAPTLDAAATPDAAPTLDAAAPTPDAALPYLEAHAILCKSGLERDASHPQGLFVLPMTARAASDADAYARSLTTFAVSDDGRGAFFATNDRIAFLAKSIMAACDEALGLLVDIKMLQLEWRCRMKAAEGAPIDGKTIAALVANPIFSVSSTGIRGVRDLLETGIIRRWPNVRDGSVFYVPQVVDILADHQKRIIDCGFMA